MLAMPTVSAKTAGTLRMQRTILVSVFNFLVSKRTNNTYGLRLKTGIRNREKPVLSRVTGWLRYREKHRLLRHTANSNNLPHHPLLR
jgi:hypothetical protein